MTISGMPVCAVTRDVQISVVRLARGVLAVVVKRAKSSYVETIGSSSIRQDFPKKTR